MRSRGLSGANKINAIMRSAVVAGCRGCPALPRALADIPQGLGSLAFNVLTATSVYIEFLDRIQLRLANYR